MRPAESTQASRWKRLRPWLLPAALIAAGAAFVWLGIARGEMETVYQKAIRVCLECIGIG